MYLLIEVAGYIEVLPTIALVMLTAVIGVQLLRMQGLSTLTRGLSRLNQGEVPAQEMAEGILLAVAGALLITPGFITDTVGFLCLFPATRAIAAGWMLSRVQVQGQFSHTFQAHSPNQRPGHGPQRPSSPTDPTIIEGDFERKSD